MSKNPSRNAKTLSARLLAVQALYQAGLNGQALNAVAEEYLAHRTGMEVEGETLVEPDGALFKAILLGVDERKDDLEGLIRGNIKDKEKKRDIEPLLKAVLQCAIWEVMTRQDIDYPIIINDYLNVAHAFYEKSEVSFINGVLDGAAKALRA